MTVHQMPRRLPSYSEPVLDVEQTFLPADNPEHPTPEGCDRLVVRQGSMLLRHGVSDGYDNVPITLTLVDHLGEAIEIGPWSMGLVEARELADTLTGLIELSHELIKWDWPDDDPKAG